MNQPMPTAKELPLISIGMPVRNEERFVHSALSALVSQQLVKFEIIISDNASNDATSAICQEFASRFPEIIRYHRFEENVGASANFVWVMEQARGDFFMWASGHDLWEPNYLYECGMALHTNPQAMIAFGTTRWIDADGAPHARSTGWSDTRGLSLPGRYFTVFWGNMNPIIALIRTSALRRQEILDMVGMDLRVLLGLALLGDFIHCPATYWSRREFRDEVSYTQKLQRYKSVEYGLGKSWLGRNFPLAELPVRILVDLFDAKMGIGLKTLMTIVLLNSLPLKYFSDRNRQGKAEAGA
jgi:glycosyltransferase involved in cell wall biosynthesis